MFDGRRARYGISLILITAMLAGMGGEVRATTYTNESIQAKQSELAGAKEQVKDLKSGLTDIQRVKDELESTKSDLNAYITQLDAQLTDITMKIDEYNRLIDSKEAEIEQARADLEEAERVQRDQYESMKKRIKFMYESGNDMYLDMLFGAGNFSDMISKADYIEMLSAYDRRKLNEYIETTEYVTACKEQYSCYQQSSRAL